MKSYSLWDLDENRWFKKDYTFETDEEAKAWRLSEIEKLFDDLRKYSWGEKQIQWIKDNYPKGLYTLFEFIEGGEPAI